MKKISDKKIMIIHDLYKDGYSERQVAQFVHLSRSTVSKYLKSNKFIALKLKNKQQSFNTIRKIDIRKKLGAKARIEEESLASNSSNNVINKKAINSQLNSSVTSPQPTKTKPSSQAKKLPIKTEAKSTPTPSSAPKEISFMPYLTKKEKQDEHDIEVVTNPRELDPFTLLQFMTLYRDVAHQLFVYKHWDILSKRLVQHHGTRALRKAERIQNIFKLKMKAREKAKNGAKYLFNKFKNSFKKSNHNKK